MRAEVSSLKNSDFVMSARAAGARRRRIIVRHLLPGVRASLVVATTLVVARNILLESALSFFGAGVQPPTPSWGVMLNAAQPYLNEAPSLAIYPGLAIVIVVMRSYPAGLAGLVDGQLRRWRAKR